MVANTGCALAPCRASMPHARCSVSPQSPLEVSVVVIPSAQIRKLRQRWSNSPKATQPADVGIGNWNPNGLIPEPTLSSSVTSASPFCYSRVCWNIECFSHWAYNPVFEGDVRAHLFLTPDVWIKQARLTEANLLQIPPFFVRWLSCEQAEDDVNIYRATAALNIWAICPKTIVFIRKMYY